MLTSKSIRFAGGVIAIVALFAATDAFAQAPFTQCTSKTTSEGAGNFTVTVAQSVGDGLRTYMYTITKIVPTGPNPNKFFVWLKQGLNTLEEGLSFPIDGPTHTYVTPHAFTASFPPADAWKVNHHQDGVVFPSLAVGTQPQFTVKERFKPEASLTTILLGVNNTYEHCGPIFGPTNPRRPEFQGSPLAQTTAHLCFTDGCCYNSTVDSTTNIITSMTVDPNTPFETNPPGGACAVDNNANCSGDLGLVFCPPGEVGRPPVQATEGGTCYFGNIKFTC